ncbi:hypothetical protein NS274_19050 [Pseudomonas oryzihabitans]|nr:hypothetical protein NS274_19050 [Pseudomonas psychrotolerans]
MKAMVAHQQLAGPVAELETLRAKRIASVAGQTLGQLMNQLLNHYLVIAGTACVAPDVKTENVASISMAIQLSLTAEDYQRIQEDMKELVRLRNTLVHHFLEQHDLWSLSGCNQAAEVLTQANAFVDRHIEQLHAWAKSLDETRSKVAAFINSEAGYDLLVDGIAPDGEVHWPGTGCIRALHAAAEVLAVSGWTSIAAAEQWIAQHHPEQEPRRYGCASWRQVIHESHLFESSRREVRGQPQLCYRPKPEASK